jgi:hypothetical protein
MIDKTLCEKIIKEIEQSRWRQHTFNDYINDKNVNRSGDDELDVCFDWTNSKRELMDITNQTIRKYVGELNFSWFDRFKDHTEIRFNRYTKNKKMAEHCDHIHSMFDGEAKGIPTLSVVGMLNEDYEGGEFIMFENKQIELKTGDIMIFPSIFLYPHRVDPVTKGTRHSFVSWVW